jgi:hypothetical protein
MSDIEVWMPVHHWMPWDSNSASASSRYLAVSGKRFGSDKPTVSQHLNSTRHPPGSGEAVGRVRRSGIGQPFRRTPIDPIM